MGVVKISPASMNGCYLIFVCVVSLRSLAASKTQREAGTGDFPQYLPRENNADIAENKYLDSNSLTEEKESRQLGLLGLGSGYGCLQLLSYIRALRLQLLYYRRALQLASLGYGGLGLGLGGTWRSGGQVGDNFLQQYQDMPGQDYSDQ